MIRLGAIYTEAISSLTIHPQQINQTLAMQIEVTTYYLEMKNPAALYPSHRACSKPETTRAAVPTPELNRFLYTAVGGAWYWVDRLDWSTRIGSTGCNARSYKPGWPIWPATRRATLGSKLSLAAISRLPTLAFCRNLLAWAVTS